MTENYKCANSHTSNMQAPKHLLHMQKTRILAAKRMAELTESILQDDYLFLERILLDRDERRETKYYHRVSIRYLCLLLTRFARSNRDSEILIDAKKLFQDFIKDEMSSMPRLTTEGVN